MGIIIILHVPVINLLEDVFEPSIVPLQDCVLCAVAVREVISMSCLIDCAHTVTDVPLGSVLTSCTVAILFARQT